MPQVVTVAITTTLAAIVTVATGWWDALSSILLEKIRGQLLLNTVAVLILVCLILTFSLIALGRSFAKRRIIIPSSVNITGHKPKEVRLPPLQEALLITAADSKITESTLSEIKHIHPQEAKFHYDQLLSQKRLDPEGGNASVLNHAGREYLLNYGLMPLPKKKS